MAKVVEEVVIVKFSRLVKDGSTHADRIVNEDLHSALEQVAQELVGEHIIVEVVVDGDQ